MKPLAYCGLDCSQCPIYKAAHDRHYAEQCAKELREKGHPDASADWFTCKGCKGNETLLYDPSCAIRACCIKKGLETCGPCPLYVCDKLQAFSKQGDVAKAAVDSLKLVEE